LCAFFPCRAQRKVRCGEDATTSTRDARYPAGCRDALCVNTPTSPNGDSLFNCVLTAERSVGSLIILPHDAARYGRGGRDRRTFARYSPIDTTSQSSKRETKA
jgi:hypothetical protein